jgi:hypothetical protein
VSRERNQDHGELSQERQVATMPANMNSNDPNQNLNTMVNMLQNFQSLDAVGKKQILKILSTASSGNESRKKKEIPTTKIDFYSAEPKITTGVTSPTIGVPSEDDT